MRHLVVPSVVAALLLCVGLPRMSAAQEVVVPQSSVEKADDAGVRAHTNVRYVLPAGGFPAPALFRSGHGGPPFPGFFYETPASMACVYNLVSASVSGSSPFAPVSGPTDSPTQTPFLMQGPKDYGVPMPLIPPPCNPNVVTQNPTGGSRVIAIVDAYDDPTAAADLRRFSKQFGLPQAKFSIVYANSIRPPVDPTGGWELEESLDIEWTHAMAPNAKIILVEARSNLLGDLLKAEDVASKLVASHGGGEVSNGWGGAEFPGESTLDSHFAKPKVVYVAASGDEPGVEYPATSPNMVAAGGTSINRDPMTGNFMGESAWQLTGGGPSAFEDRPTYQDGISGIVGDARGTPDLSLDGDLNSGAWVYDGNPTGGRKGWFIVGGTSLSSAALAGIINNAGNFYASTNDELTVVYSNLGNPNDFRDITLGTCGPYVGYEAETGWDFCTGVGSSLGLDGK